MSSTVIRYHYIFDIDSMTPLERQAPDVQASLACEWSRYLPYPDPGPDAVQLSRLEHDTILSRCLYYGRGWLFGLVPELFLRGMAHFLQPQPTIASNEHNTAPNEAQHYTPLLHCSLLAFAAAFSDNPDIRARTTRDKLANHAKQWLDEEFGNASPNLILALIFLSEYHCGVDEKNAGYMYLGMAISVARTAGANAPPRNWYHWSTFVQEKLMALYTGTPSEMPVPKTASARPELNGTHTHEHTEPLANEDGSEVASWCLIQSCKLMVYAAPIINQSSYDNDIIAKLQGQLDSWLDALPTSLCVLQQPEETELPVICLHVCYWWLVLRLHFPSLEHSQSIGSESIVEPSIEKSKSATRNLMELFDAYHKQRGLRYFPRNMLRAIHACGCVFLLDISAPGEARTPGQGIETCISYLSNISEIWPCAKPLAESLEAQKNGAAVVA